MPVVLNITYLLLILAAAPWLAYGAWRHGKYRDGLAQKWLGRAPLRSGSRPCVWFHAVSVGEVNLLRPLIARWSTACPDWDCVISTTTKTGYELARQKYADRTVFYCPLDFSWAVRAALRRVRPDLLVLAELELWPNLILAARRTGCRVAIVNGRLSERSFRGYRRIRPLVRRLLQHVDLLAVQNEEYADRFRKLGAAAERVRITGSVKFDGVQSDRSNPATVRLGELAGLASDDVVLLAGSTQAPEEALVVEAFQELQPRFPRLRLILVPRHTTRCGEIARLLERQGLDWQRRSDLDGGGRHATARVLLVDTIGELAAWWGTAQIAFVGGSLGSRGGQNMIEPAAYGAAVCFGPNTRNFRDIVQLLLACRGARVVQDGAELREFVQGCLEDPGAAREMGRLARELVAAHQGASDRTLAYLREAIGGMAARRSAA